MWRRLAGLLALVALIGAVAWQWSADERDAREHTLTQLEPDAISHIEVTLRGLPTQRFDRHAGHWVSRAGPADEGRAAELAALAATPVAEWKPASAFDASKIGLAPPAAVLVLDGVRIEFGDMAALGRQRYARVGHAVAFVPAQALPRAARTRSLPTSNGASP